MVRRILPDRRSARNMRPRHAGIGAIGLAAFGGDRQRREAVGPRTLGEILEILPGGAKPRDGPCCFLSSMHDLLKPLLSHLTTPVRALLG